MSAKTKQTQHRVEREVTRGKELTEARREIKQLKKLVARLQKTIRKYENERGIQLIIEAGDPEPAMAEAEPVEALPEVTQDPDRCGACGSANLATLKIPSGKIIVSCKDCKTRR